MKKVCAYILWLALLVAGTCATAMAETVNVQTKDELRAALMANKNIMLIEDIDLTGWETITADECVYSGTMSGLDADRQHTDGSAYCYSLKNGTNAILQCASNATFTNIILDGFSIDRNVNDLGILVGEADQCTFDYICVWNCEVNAGAVSDLITGNTVGLVAGKAVGCQFVGAMVMASHVTCDGVQAGTLVGYAERCDFNQCATALTSSVFADGGGVNAYVGGLCGESKYGSFTSCVNMATVGADDDRVGGMVGFSTGTKFFGCYNIGYICICDSKDDFLTIRSAMIGGAAGAATYMAGMGLLFGVWCALPGGMAEGIAAAYSTFLQVIASHGVSFIAPIVGTFAYLLPVIVAVVVGVAIYEAQGSDEVGGMAGAAYGGLFEQCVNMGVVRSADAYAGGIVGWAQADGDNNPVIRSCMNQGYVYGQEQTGGIVGSMDCGSLRGCLNVGQVNLRDVETMTEEEATWGAIWGEKGSSVTAEGHLCLAGKTDPDDKRACRGVNDDFLSSGQAAMYLNRYAAEDYTWRQHINVDRYPSPLASDDKTAIVTHDAVASYSGEPVYTEVATAADLYFAVANPYNRIRLTADINLALPNPYEANSYYGELCNVMWPFQGILDGDGHVLSGLTIEKDQLDVMGLFDYAQGATFRNLILKNASLHGDNNVGALVGISKNCHYENVALVGAVALRVDDDNLGGLVGSSDHDTFTDCGVSVAGSFQSDDYNVGGLCGTATGSTFTGCWLGFAGSDTQTLTLNADNENVGGMVGKSEGCTYANCVAAGVHFSVMDYTVGGIVGLSNKDTFTDCLTQQCAIYSDGDGDDAYAGGIAGKADHSTFTRCTNNSQVIGNDDYVGGIVATAVVCTFDHCVNRAAVSHEHTSGASAVDEVVGGICARADGCTFDACANYAAVSSGDDYCGGICGYSDDEDADGETYETIFHNCLNAGVITCNDNYAGGICGSLNDSKIDMCLNVGLIQHGNEDSDRGPIYGTKDGGCTLSNCYYYDAPYKQSLDAFIKTSYEELQSGIIAWRLNDGNLDGPWHQNIGTLAGWHPSLDASDDKVTIDKMICNYTIGTADELMTFASKVNGGQTSLIAELTADIDLTDKTWTPIGSESKPYRGIFRGNGHTISHLMCSTETRGAGFFGTLGAGAGIYDVSLDQTCVVQSTSYGVGSIAGRVAPATDGGFAVISGCGSKATLKGQYNVGGILGNVWNERPATRLLISNCYYESFSLIASGTNQYGTGESAMICGYAGKHATIENCYAFALMEDDDYDQDQAYVRGNNVTIRNCYLYDIAVAMHPGYAQKDVDLFSNEEAVNGTLTYRLNGQTNDSSQGIRWEQNIYNDEEPSLVPMGTKSKGVYNSRNITNSLGTIVLPYDAVSYGDVTYYVLMGANADGSLSFEHVDVLPAGTPAVFTTPIKGTLIFRGDDSDQFGYAAIDVEQGLWTMKGYFGAPDKSLVFTSDKDDMTTLYYISGGQVKHATNSLTVAPLRAYLEGPAFSGAQSIAIRLDGSDVTAIEWAECSDDTNANGNANIYNLQGQQVDGNYKGIVIVNGKKVWMK